MNPGIAFAAAAFTIWGLFPLYFRQVAQVQPLEMMLQRSLWSLVFVAAVLALLRRWAWVGALRREPRQLAVFAFTALMLAGNWVIYVYAIQSHQVVEASLGYFINPLVSVLLGVTILRERLSRLKWVAVALAAAGVAWLTWHMGRLPWIALVLAVSFGLYGLVRKTATLGALEGLATETALLAPLVLPLLAWWTFTQPQAALPGASAATWGWLVLAGPLSALPLWLFAEGARRLPLATVGMVQYLSPSLQLALGVWLFGEPFDATRLIGFACIWAALALVSLEALRAGWRRAQASG